VPRKIEKLENDKETFLLIEEERPFRRSGTSFGSIAGRGGLL
jgi:hypothetical protein